MKSRGPWPRSQTLSGPTTTKQLTLPAGIWRKSGAWRSKRRHRKNSNSQDYLEEWMWKVSFSYNPSLSACSSTGIFTRRLKRWWGPTPKSCKISSTTHFTRSSKPNFRDPPLRSAAAITMEFELCTKLNMDVGHLQQCSKRYFKEATSTARGEQLKQARNQRGQQALEHKHYHPVVKKKMS